MDLSKIPPEASRAQDVSTLMPKLREASRDHPGGLGMVQGDLIVGADAEGVVWDTSKRVRHQ